MDYNARFYSPRLMRFTQPDTLVPGMSSQAFNRYSYVSNNPLNFTDPTGHREDGACGYNGNECPNDPLPNNPGPGNDGGDSGADEPGKIDDNARDETIGGACPQNLILGYSTTCTNMAMAAYIILNTDDAWNTPDGQRAVISAYAYFSGEIIAHGVIAVYGKKAAQALILKCMANPICAAGLGIPPDTAQDVIDGVDDTAAAIADYAAIGSTGAVGEGQLYAEFGGATQESYLTTTGWRYVDVLSPDNIALESKVGYTSLTKFIMTQIAKDVELFTTGQVEGVQWHFYTSPVTGAGGPSTPLLQYLIENGIEVVIHP